MTVYVDNMYKYPLGQFGRMKMSHMVADTTEELLAMADKIGVNRRWIQYPGTEDEHFDISITKRQLAVQNGAVEITMRELAQKRRIDLGGSAAPPSGVVCTPDTRIPDKQKASSMQITIDTNNLSDLDIAMLAFLAEQGEETETADEPEPAPAKAEKPKKAAAKAEPKPEPEEDLLGGGDDAPTVSDAVAAATELVSKGEAPKVKAALAEVGVKRVSEMKDEDVPTFLAALAAGE